MGAGDAVVEAASRGGDANGPSGEGSITEIGDIGDGSVRIGDLEDRSEACVENNVPGSLGDESALSAGIAES